jgi:hypothetical protein
MPMNSRCTRAVLVAAALTVTLAAPSMAQIEGNLGALTPENAKAYLQPLPKALSATLNSAIFQSAAIPMAGINLTVGIHVMGVTFDSKDKRYTPTDPPGFTSTAPIQQVPTVVGDVNAVAQSGQGGTTMYYPGGFNLKQFLIGVPQVSIGSVFGTRLVGRWIQFDAGDNELGHVKLLGIGAQHSINHYLPHLPVNVAVGGMYQTFQLGSDKLIDTKAMHVDVTASKKFAMFFQPYVGVGYDTFQMKANYTQDLGSGQKADVHVKFNDENSAHLTAGLLVGLPVVKLSAEFDSGAETGASVGLRFGLGN